MFLAVIFAVLALAMIVGPLMMLRPSPRQAQLIKLRGIAADRGLRVQMLDNPTARVESDAASSKPEMVAAYGMQLQADADSPLGALRWMLARTAFSHGIHLGGVWDWSVKEKTAPIEEETLLAFLQNLPKSVLAVRQDGDAISILWSERVPQGETLEQAFETLYQSLLQLRALLHASVTSDNPNTRPQPSPKLSPRG